MAGKMYYFTKTNNIFHIMQMWSDTLTSNKIWKNASSWSYTVVLMWDQWKLVSCVSFVHDSLFLCQSLFRQTTALCSVSLVKWLNRELYCGLTHYQLALLVFTASWQVDLTVFIASHLKPIHYRKRTQAALAPNKKPFSLKRYWQFVG